MRKFLALAAAGALFATPVLAQTMTVEFADDAGQAITVTLAGDGTYTASDGTAGTYTWDIETKTLCGTSDEGTLCATIAEATETPAVGDSSPYTTDAGGSGTATITALEE